MIPAEEDRDSFRRKNSHLVPCAPKWHLDKAGGSVEGDRCAELTGPCAPRAHQGPRAKSSDVARGPSRSPNSYREPRASAGPLPGPLPAAGICPRGGTGLTASPSTLVSASNPRPVGGVTPNNRTGPDRRPRAKFIQPEAAASTLASARGTAPAPRGRRSAGSAGPAPPGGAEARPRGSHPAGTAGVCGWLAAAPTLSVEQLGGLPKPVAVDDVTGWLGTSSCGAHAAAQPRPQAWSALRLRRTAPWGPQRGKLDGPVDPRAAMATGGVPGPGGAGPEARTPPAVVTIPPPRGLSRGGPSRACPRATIGTWLILPVVICLSQRLSHACLSISNLYRETANGSLNQLSFI